MNSRKTNPLAQALAASQRDGAHADLDVLAAFAEGTLAERERGPLVAHLALCPECRELLDVATAAADTTTGAKPFVVARGQRPALKQWLPWAGLAAAMVIASGAGLVYEQRRPSQGASTLASEGAAKSTASEGQASHTDKASAQPTRPMQGAGVHDSSEPNAAFSPGDAPGGDEKLRARPHWRINSLGQPERSVADGPWQRVLADEPTKMHVIAVVDHEIWIGGEDARLYHSTDEGNHWRPITLPGNNPATQTIVHIHFSTQLDGTIEAADGRVWKTTDGGANWK